MASYLRQGSRFLTTVSNLTHASFQKLLPVPNCEEVLFGATGKVGVVFLNRPKHLNALTVNMMHNMISAFEQFIQDKKSLIIVQGKGGKAFSAGGDVLAMAESARNRTAWCRQLFHGGYRHYYATSILPIPHCAFINGFAMGGGAAIALHGRYVIGTEKSVFAMPEVQIGYFPNAGGTYFLTRLKGKLGYYLGLTGNSLKGADVYHAGVATHAIDSANYPQLETELFSLPFDDPFKEVESCLEKFTKEAKFLQNKPFSLAPHMDLINECFSAPTVEGIFENLSKSNDPFAKATLEKLSSLSPLALKVTKKALDQVATKSLADCFQMEYRLSVRLCESHDFLEGVRGRIIEKGSNPVWKPNRLEDCTDEYVDSFFAPLPEHDLLDLHEVRCRFSK